MYKYVDQATAKKYEKICNRLLAKVTKNLKDKYHVHCHFELIGSGKKKLVTSNGKGAFDLDYNLVLTKYNGRSSDELNKLKNYVRQTVDACKGVQFSYGSDSIVPIHYRCVNWLEAEQDGFAGFDLAIIRETEKHAWQRLRHDEQDGTFNWLKVFDSRELKRKAKMIAAQNLDEELRKVYLKLKNQYINDKNHPSYVVYGEAVNQVYQLIR